VKRLYWQVFHSIGQNSGRKRKEKRERKEREKREKEKGEETKEGIFSIGNQF
jgi:hypothetical protein